MVGLVCGVYRFCGLGELEELVDGVRGSVGGSVGGNMGSMGMGIGGRGGSPQAILPEILLAVHQEFCHSVKSTQKSKH